MNPIPPTGSATRILLVAESSALRETIEEMLGSDGFDVLTASNRPDAVDRLRGGAIGLVLIDMLMPRAVGIGTLIAVRSCDPGMKIVAMSCEPQETASHFLPLAESLGAAALLSEPLDAAKLIDCVRGLLAADSRRIA